MMWEEFCTKSSFKETMKGKCFIPNRLPQNERNEYRLFVRVRQVKALDKRVSVRKISEVKVIVNVKSDVKRRIEI
jgi:hypothetical protein